MRNANIAPKNMIQPNVQRSLQLPFSLPRQQVRSLWSCLILLAFVFFQFGCATYQTKVSEARQLIASNQNDRALQILEPLAQKESDDQLVYMLDYAVALQQAGRYSESAKILVAAERIADIQDYTSISKETASILLSEGFVQYKGDDYEKVLINAVNAINFLMMGDLENALVQVRRLNNKLHLYKTEAKRNYEQNPFAFYLGAIIWEADKKWDEAYIFYKRAYELIPDYAPLREDLVRAAIRAQRPEDVQKWQVAFPEVKIKPEWRDPSMGELIVVFQQGWGPRKKPHPASPRVPKLYPVPSYTRQAVVTVSETELATTSKVFSVQDVAIKTLDDQYAALITKRVAGVAAKAVVADQLRQKNQLLGSIAWIAMNVADQADLRQWSTLPESFQIARLPLKAGTYQVDIKGTSDGGVDTGEAMETRETTIKAGRKNFVLWRSLR